MVLAIVSPVARAEVVSPYSFDFSGLDTSSHSFAPSGWGHIVESYDDYEYGNTDYVKYTQKATGGIDDSACLYCGSQNIGYDYVTVYDLLVTPKVSGNVSIWVKKEKTSGNIKFYTCSVSGSSFNRVAEYSVTLPTLSTSEWVEVTLPNVPEGTYLGIRGDYVYLDNFTAENAEIEAKRSLTLSSATAIESSAIANAEGNAFVSFNVSVVNSGEVTFNPGDEGYSLSLRNNSTSTDYAECPITVALAPGESTEMVVSAYVPVTQYVSQSFYIKENINGTTKFGAWIDLYPNTSNLSFAINDAATSLTPGDAIVFGTTKDTDIEKKIYIVNTTGGAPLTVNSVALPEGFAVSGIAIDATDAVATTTFPFEVGARKRAILTVKLDHTVVGNHSGDLTINVDGYDAAVFPVSGVVISESQFYETFESGAFPAGAMSEYEGMSTSWEVYDYNYADYALRNGRVDESKFIFPKMSFTEGDVFAFDAARRSSVSNLRVYYSADRNNWTMVKEITVDNEDDSCKFSDERYSTSSSYDTWKYKSFTANIPAGEWYVAFGAGYVWVDNVAGGTLLPLPENETVIYGVTIPEEATCNHSYEIAGQLFNLTAADFAEGEYVARFYIGEEMVGEKLISDVAKSGASRFSITVTPHKAGSFIAHLDIVKVADGTVINTLTGSQTVAEEVPVGEQQVGIATGTSYSVPITLNYKNSDNETVYLASDINLHAGTVINGFHYLGYRSADPIDKHITVYMQNTEDVAPDSANPTDVSTMTKVFDADVTFVKGGSKSDLINLLNADAMLNNFTYEGNNLRVVVVQRSSGYKLGNFESNNQNKNQSIHRYSDGDITTTSFAFCELPIIHLHVDKEASTLSGTVTDGTNPVEGAEVKIADGDVYYKGTTDAEGKYSFTVYQDKRNYSLTVKKSGYFDYSDEINLNGGALVKNIVLQDASGFKLLSATFPTNGEVNSAMTVTAQLLNGVEKREGSYSAALYVNDEIVASAPAYSMGENATVDFSFSYTPHVVGDVTAYVKFAIDDIVAQSEPATISIAEEKAVAEQQVGAHSTSSKNGPAYLFYKRSKTELIYPKSYINLPAGTAIQSIKFKGYVSSAKSAIFTYNAWMGNVAEGTALQGETTEGMTQIMTNREETYNEVKGSNSEFVDILTIDLPEGFVYDGGDLRFFFTCEGTEYTGGVFFDVTSITGQAKQGYNDNSTLENISLSNSIPLPVLYLGMDPKKTVSGVVTDAATSEPIEGATVTLMSDNIRYSGTTDASGAYSIDVIKHSLDYSVLVKAPGYSKGSLISLSFATGDQTDVNFALNKVYTVKGNVVDLDGYPVEEMNTSLKHGDNVIAFVITDENGAYQFDNVEVTDDTWAIEFEGTADCAGATVPISTSTAVDGVITINATLNDASYKTAKGVVTDAETNAPVAGAEVSVSNMMKTYTTTTDENGAYSIEIDQYRSQIYNLEVSAPGYASYVGESAVWFQFGSAECVNNVALNKVFTIAGKAKDLDGYGIEGMTVNLKESDVTILSTVTDSEGAYSFENIDLSFGAWTLEFTGTADCAPLSTLVDKSAAQAGVVTVNVTLPDVAFKTAKGVVTDMATGEPIEEANVVIHNSTIYYGTVTDSNGAYSIEIDQYRSKIYNIDVIASGYCSYVSESAVWFQWGSGECVNDIQLLKAYKVKGSVIDNNNAPIVGYEVKLCDEGSVVLTATTDAEGKYEFDSLIDIFDGVWSVDFDSNNEYSEYHKPISFEDGEDSVVTVDAQLTYLGAVGSLNADSLMVYGAKGAIIVKAPKATVVNVYNAAGVLMRSVAVEPGTTRLDGFTAGAYIVGTTKVAVK